ncbi:MAG: hypothetical protein A2341_05420 [Deltaproteobacteria bacterium RIFOXYB12_FULL_58_9]|nr:MAG: hypothetical protein A2341_05420 [Deltaproteobacteria bacterium RIFOXYB12_FULL_58_9]
MRHIWGNPWDPQAFTAGWNLTYMPYWAGMLTEEQHCHDLLQQAIRQASWNLYFAADPVCPPPDYVTNPGLDLKQILGDTPLLVLGPSDAGAGCGLTSEPVVSMNGNAPDLIRAKRSRRIPKGTETDLSRCILTEYELVEAPT